MQSALPADKFAEMSAPKENRTAIEIRSAICRLFGLCPKQFRAIVRTLLHYPDSAMLA